MALDKIQIAALRKADRIAFHHRPGAGENVKPASWIDAIQAARVTTADPFSQDRMVTVTCAHRFTDYERESGQHVTDGAFTGFDMIHTAHACEEWQTVASLLQAGDALTLHWQRGAWGSPALRDAGIVGDRLLLVVERGKRRLTFTVGHYTGPPNTARMVRVA